MPIEPAEINRLRAPDDEAKPDAPDTAGLEGRDLAQEIQPIRDEIVGNLPQVEVAESPEKPANPASLEPDTAVNAEVIPAEPLVPVSSTNNIEKKKPFTFKSALKSFGNQFVETVKLYAKVIRDPKLIIKGAWQVIKDTCNLPRAIFGKKEYASVKEKIAERTSQAVTLSEVMSSLGGSVGSIAAKILGFGSNLEIMIISIVLNYLAGASSYIIGATAMTRKCEGYTLKSATIDSLKVVRDCLPMAAACYTFGILIYNFLVEVVGMNNIIVVIINTIWGTILFSGVAKVSSNEQLNKKPTF